MVEIYPKRLFVRRLRAESTTLFLTLMSILFVEVFIKYASYETIELSIGNKSHSSSPEVCPVEPDPFFRKWANFTCKSCFLKDTEFLIESPALCAAGGRTTKMLFLINSHHANYKKRKSIRETWTTRLDGLNMKYVFVFGVSKKQLENEQIQNEARAHNDVIQADFIEQYTNLNLKTVTALKWTLQHCPNVDFIFKTDDDMFINPNAINSLLNRGEFQADSTIYGNCMSSGYPHRGVFSKWYAPLRFYPHRYYGPFCLGSAFIMSISSVAQLYNASRSTPYFNVEDVYISGLCGANNGLKMLEYPGIHMNKRNLPNCPNDSKYIASLQSDISSFYELWEQLKLNNCIKV